MKKNLLTIIILALAFINAVLSALIIFVIVPTSNKTNKIVNRVASIIDLELENPKDGDMNIGVSDIETYTLEDKLQINLAKSDDDEHFAILSVSLSINLKNEDTPQLQEYIVKNEAAITEIVTDEFSKFTINNVKENKNVIKQQILVRIQELFNSDFIINVSFGNIVYK
jgi:flagellar FliL protein